MKTRAKMNAVESAAKGIFTVCAVIAVFAVCSITVYMAAKGAPAFTNVGVLDLFSGRFGSRLRKNRRTAFFTLFFHPLQEREAVC